jgi:FkbM family methyltransferase
VTSIRSSLRRLAYAWAGRADVATRHIVAELDRPRSRWLLVGLGSAAASVAHGRRCRAQPLGGGRLALRYREGVIVARTPWVPTPARMRRATLDTFCWSYTPGPGDTVLDLGAGIGEEAMTFSELVGPEGRVVCVEAHPSTFDQLTATCRVNGLTNVRCEQYAIADTPGEVRMEASVGPTHVGAAIGDERGVPVPAETVDGLVSRLALEHIDLLKMNIEGAERLAVRAMDETLGRTSHVVVSCHDFLVPLFGADPAEVATFDTVRHFLCDRGFDVVTRPDDHRPWIPYYLYGARPR